jgi:CheY-like chemotaxis protein
MVEAAETPYDAILMDMLMPEMGGIEATEHLRLVTKVTTPIVAMTANASDRDRDECRRVGMNGFISKPVLRNALNETLLRVLNGGGKWTEERS